MNGVLEHAQTIIDVEKKERGGSVGLQSSINFISTNVSATHKIAFFRVNSDKKYKMYIYSEKTT